MDGREEMGTIMNLVSGEKYRKRRVAMHAVHAKRAYKMGKQQ